MESGPQGASPLLRQDVPTPPRRNLAIYRLNNQFLPDSQISLAPSRIFKLPASDRVRPQCVAMSSPQAQTPPAIGHLPAVPAASTSHGAPPGGHAPVPKIPVIKRALKILSRHGQQGCGGTDPLRCEHGLPNHVGGTAGACLVCWQKAWLPYYRRQDDLRLFKPKLGALPTDLSRTIPTSFFL